MTEAQPTVLVADDDLEILRIIRRRLYKEYRVLEAHNGAEALTLAMEECPDAIVLDVMMPELNGWEVAKHLRKKSEFDKVGIIMLTAIGPTLNELTSPLYGADAQVDKPFDLEVLADTIRKVLLSKRG
jgi:DNA-binding response OmpR family regulator